MSSFSVVENSFLLPPPCLHLILNVEKLSPKPSSSFTSRGVEIEFCFLELVIFLLWVECHYCSKRGMNERIWVRIQVEYECEFKYEVQGGSCLRQRKLWPTVISMLVTIDIKDKHQPCDSWLAYLLVGVVVTAFGHLAFVFTWEIFYGFSHCE